MTDLNLTDWLSGATVAEMSVDVYQRPDLLGKINEWERRLERATAAGDAERSAGEPDPIAALEAEGEALLAELEASKSVWYMRALSSDDEDAINEAHPLPEPPARFAEKPPVLTARPTEVQSQAFLKAHEAYEQRKTLHDEERRPDAEKYVKQLTVTLKARGVEKIVRSLARIEAGGSVIATAITAEQAATLPAKIGEQQTGKILEAIADATQIEPELPASFSRASSETTPA